jgi:hypothetical protein
LILTAFSRSAGRSAVVGSVTGPRYRLLGCRPTVTNRWVPSGRSIGPSWRPPASGPLPMAAGNWRSWWFEVSLIPPRRDQVVADDCGHGVDVPSPSDADLPVQSRPGHQAWVRRRPGLLRCSGPDAIHHLSRPEELYEVLCELTVGEKVRTRATGMRTSPPATLTPRLGRRPALPGCPERPTDLRGPSGRLRRRVRRSATGGDRAAQAARRSPGPESFAAVRPLCRPPFATTSDRSPEILCTCGVLSDEIPD